MFLTFGKSQNVQKNCLSSRSLSIISAFYSIFRPLWVEYPEDKATFTMEDEYLLGIYLMSSLGLS